MFGKLFFLVSWIINVVTSIHLMGQTSRIWKEIGIWLESLIYWVNPWITRRIYPPTKYKWNRITIARVAMKPFCNYSIINFIWSKYQRMKIRGEMSSIANRNIIGVTSWTLPVLHNPIQRWCLSHINVLHRISSV